MIYGIVLNPAYVESVKPFLEDYLTPMAGRYAGNYGLSATAIDYTMLHLVATVKDRTQDFEADIHLPHGSVMLVVSAKETKSIGFLADVL